MIEAGKTIQECILRLREAREKASNKRWQAVTISQFGQCRASGPCHHRCPATGNLVQAQINSNHDAEFIALAANVFIELIDCIEAVSKYQFECDEIAGASSQWVKSPAEIGMDEALTALVDKMENAK